MGEKLNILLISNAFYPEISPRSFRSTELAKEFVRQGHEVSVYTKYRDFDYTEFLKEHPMKFKMWKKDQFPKVPQWNGNIGSLFSRGMNRILLMLFEYPGIEDLFKVKQFLKKESGYDLIISFAVPYPVHWGVASARTQNHPIGKHWIADCGDPFMGCETDSFKKPFYFKYIEKWFFRKTDLITIPIESAIQAYYAEFRHKIHIIPQGFSFNEINIPKFIKNEISPTFAYAGGFIQGIRDPRLFLDFLATVKKPFKFVVYTNSANLIEPYKKILGEKLEIKSYIPRNELLRDLSQMDFLINFDNNTIVQSPSKLIDYAIVKRPVLNILKSIEKDKIINFINGNYSDRMQLKNLEKYDIKNVAKQFISLTE